MDHGANSLDIRPTRHRFSFSTDDFDFISTVLGHDHDADSLASLYADPEALDILLDERLLSDVLLSMPCEMNVSSRFYLYVILRRTFLESQVDDRCLTYYVAETLMSYLHSPEMKTSKVCGDPMGYVFDEIKKIQRSKAEDAFSLRLHVGNFLLFLLGVHPERCILGRLAISPPDFFFLERMGRSYLSKACNDPLASEEGLDVILGDLVTNYRTVRLCIYKLAEMNAFDRESRRMPSSTLII